MCPTQTPASRADRRRAEVSDALSARAFLGAALGLGAVLGALCVLVQRRGSQWFADDFLYLQLARDGELTPSWLVVDNYGHFAPLTRLAYLAVQRTVGLDYGWASLLPAAIVLTIFASLVWLFRELLGRRPVALLLAVLGATSVPIVRTMLWWGASVHVLGGAAFMTLSLAAFAAYSTRGQERYRIASVLALVGGLLVQERPMILIGYLVLIRYLFRLGLPDGAAWFRPLRREIAFWWPWVAVEAAYVYYRLFVFPAAPAPGGGEQALELIGQSVLRGYAPSLVGVRNSAESPLITAAGVIGLLGLAAAVAVLLVVRRGAWRVPAFLTAVYVVNLAILAIGRLDVASVAAVVVDLQYYVDVHIATVVALVLGWSQLPIRPRQAVRVDRSRALEAVALTLTAALAVSTAITWRGVTAENAGTTAHRWVNRAVGELETREAPYAIARTKLPLLVAPSFIDPWTDTSSVLALDPAIAARLDPRAPDKVAVTESGQVLETHPNTILELDLSDPSVEVVGQPGEEALRRTDDAVCISGSTDSALRVRLPRPLSGPDLFYGVTYEAPGRTVTRAVGQGRKDQLTFNSFLTDLPAGAGTVVDRLDGDRLSQLILTFEQGVDDVCVSSLWIGRLAVDDAGGCRLLSDYGEPGRESDACGTDWQ